MPLTWHDPASAKTALGISVSDAQLNLAREECLHRRGLVATLAEPPSQSFADGVVYQALANKQSSQANSNDEMGGNDNSVRLYPFDKKIQAMLIVPDSFAITDEIRDHSYVRSLVG